MTFAKGSRILESRRPQATGKEASRSYSVLSRARLRSDSLAGWLPWGQWTRAQSLTLQAEREKLKQKIRHGLLWVPILIKFK